MKSLMGWEAYWDAECHNAMYLNEPFYEFLFDLFCEMLFHQAFGNEGHPFYLGHVTAKYKTKVSSGDVNTCFQPSGKCLDSNACISHIGQKEKSYLSNCA